MSYDTSTVYDYKKYAILYVDDEERSLKGFERAFQDQFRIFTAINAEKGFQLLEAHKDDIGVLLTDQRMPGQKGVELLERVRQLRPRVIRILVTAYADYDAVIQAVNTGAIYKYISKPWDVRELEMTLKHALEFFMVQNERDLLLKEKISALHRMIIRDRIVSLGVLASGLGHYVRNSLVTIRTFLDLAPEMLRKENVDMADFKNTEFWKDFYQQVRTQVKRITELLRQLGEASEKPSFQFDDKVELKGVLERTLEKMNPDLNAKGIKIENHIPESLPPLTVDKSKFPGLFELLLKDALISLPAGSCVSFRAKALPSKPGGTPEIQLEVEDNGPGLSKEALRSIFDPFFLRQEDPQEFGINLMGCYFIVYHHGGKIDVQSKESGGLTFVITLPSDPKTRPIEVNENEFLAKILLNDSLLEKLWAGV